MTTGGNNDNMNRRRKAVSVMVYVLCGKIASGKTSQARRISRRTGAVVLSCDELMLTVFTGCLGEGHAAAESRCLTYLCGLALRLAGAGKDSVIDAGLWTAEERKRVMKIFSDAGAEARLIWVTTDEEERKRRLELRAGEPAPEGRRVFRPDAETLRRLDSLFETPAEGECDVVIRN